MRFQKIISLLFILLLSTSGVLAAHFILGKVNDALDSTSANGRTVVLWNPSIGRSDNITDIIGITGNSNQPNIYMVDCELLANGCSIGDQLNIEVLDLGDGYVAEIATTVVTEGGFDLASEITLNSLPNISLETPVDNANLTSPITFNCSAIDLDSNLNNVTLYGNWSGGWHANETTSLTGTYNSTVFTKNLPEGIYEWNCLIYDNLSKSKFADNNKTFVVDNTSPEMFAIEINESYLCGADKSIIVNCTTNDSFIGIDKVIIEAIGPQSTSNYSTSEIFPDVYSTEIPLNQKGSWQFVCYANDSSGNSNSISSDNVSVYSETADIIIFSNNINFSDNSPIENQEINIETTIYNNGCQEANNFLVGFYSSDPDLGSQQIGQNKTLNIAERSSNFTNITWAAQVGPTNIFIKADVSNIISEDNESNNKANKTINVEAWQEFFGIINSSKILGDFYLNNISLWFNESTSSGNVFVADRESTIDWTALQAIGRSISGQNSSDDFEDIDIILEMTSYNDSVKNKFTTEGYTPKETTNFTINYEIIENVPVIPSTNNTNFITGILWDSSYDTDDEFSETDNEAIIFVTKINKETVGAYGTYDYEIKVPVNLRSQDQTDNSELYFYYELI